MGKKEYNRLAAFFENLLTAVPDKNPQYFEGELQLRSPNEELLRFVANQCNKNNIWVAAVRPLTTGLDIKISSQRFLRSLGKRIANSYKGELKTSRSLFTRNRQTSKEVYRVTVLFRMNQPE